VFHKEGAYLLQQLMLAAITTSESFKLAEVKYQENNKVNEYFKSFLMEKNCLLDEWKAKEGIIFL
jgi:hypothetical protein